MPGFLKRQYPYDCHIGKGIVRALSVGLFVYLFLILFRPFGLNLTSREDLALRLPGYGIITAVVIFFFTNLIPLGFRKFFDESNWNIGKQIILVTIIVISITIGNTLFTKFFIVDFEFNISEVFFFFIVTVILSIFPVTIIILVHQSRILKMNLKSAENLNKLILNNHAQSSISVPQELILNSESANDYVQIHPNNLVFIKSEGNYAKLTFYENNEIKQKLIRATLKNIEKAVIPFPEIIRCHRAYIINLQMLEMISGNSQGYTVKLENIKEEIPVSRSNIKMFNKKATAEIRRRRHIR